MKKTYKVVNVELRPAPKGSFVSVCLLDYTPDVEDVDPQQDQMNKLRRLLPKETADSIMPFLESAIQVPLMFSGDFPRHSAHKETASILLTSREYQEMGEPSVGKLVAVDLAIAGEPITVHIPLARELFKQAFRQLEGPTNPDTPPKDRQSILRAMLLGALEAKGLRPKEAGEAIDAALREGLIYESKPSFYKSVGNW